jgi:serine phosphatase RsbU (regulator of sigma subunit)
MRTSAWWRAHELVLPLAVLATIVALDILLGPEIVLSATFAIAAVVASVVTTVRRTTLVAVLAVAASAVSGVWNDNYPDLDWWIRLTLSCGLGALAVAIASMRARREGALRHMTVIAETAQRALLRALPTTVGTVGFAARYVSATEAALVGGDLYEVAETPYGVRVIVGDVRGKGLDAVQMAATVLAAFRRGAFMQPSLATIATDLDAVVTAVAGEEDFVTAVLAEFHDDNSVTLVNCGHHAPLLVKPGGGAELLETGEPELPLGLGTTPSSTTATWPAGSRLLIYTDGLVEARDGRGEFFPLIEHADVLEQGSGDEALDGLLSLLDEYADHRHVDDIALVLAEHRDGVPAVTVAG